MGYQTKCEPGCTCRKHFAPARGDLPRIVKCHHCGQERWDGTGPCAGCGGAQRDGRADGS